MPQWRSAVALCVVFLVLCQDSVWAKEGARKKRSDGRPAARKGGGGGDGLAGLFDAFMSGNSGSAKESLGGLSDLLNYGNWCGPDNTKDDPQYRSIDKVDEACREHDLCLRDLGYHDCKCDRKFLKDLKAAEGYTAEAFGELYRSGAISIFKEKPCECVDPDSEEKIAGKGGRCKKKKQEI